MRHHRIALLAAAGFAVAWMGAATLILTSARLPAEASGRVLAVFPPGLGGMAVSARIIAAGGMPLEGAGGDVGWIAYSPDPGFAGRLEAQGAMLVVPPIGGLRFSGICGGGMELLASRAE